MKHIVVGDQHYIVSEAAIKKRDHKVPAGVPYRISTIIHSTEPFDSEFEVRLLKDIAKAENRQKLHWAIIAGLSAGAGYALFNFLLTLVSGGASGT